MAIKNILWWESEEQIPLTGNTWPSHLCVIHDYWFYTITLSQYHWCSQYHETMPIPWIYVYTMSPCQYLDSMSIPWVLFNKKSHCSYHVSINKREMFYRDTLLKIIEKQITGIRKNKLQRYYYTNYIIQMKEL